jgi:hypothetical protein
VEDGNANGGPGSSPDPPLAGSAKGSQVLFATFFMTFLFVTRVAAAFVVAFELFEGTAFGEIFFSAM